MTAPSRSRVLWFQAEPVYPARGGAAVRAAGLINILLTDGHEVMLVHPSPGNGAPAAVVPPGCSVVTVDQWTGLRGRFSRVAPPLPMHAPRISALSAANAGSAIAAFAPDLCVVSELSAWGLARVLRPPVPWIYDATNVERELLPARRETVRTVSDWTKFRIDARRVPKVELQLLREATVVTSVSRRDATELRALEPRARVHVVPNSVPTQTDLVDTATSAPLVLFVGTLHYPPNVEAVRELVTQIMPRIRERLPEAQLHIVGRQPEPELLDLIEPLTWTRLSANLPDLRDAYTEARCVILPIRSGSGTNIKLFEALSYGVPVVATPKAVQGIEIHADAEVIVREHGTDLADRALSVLTDDSLAADLGASGHHAFVTRLSWDRAAAVALRAAVAEALISA